MLQLLRKREKFNVSLECAATGPAAGLPIVRRDRPGFAGPLLSRLSRCTEP